MSNTPPIVSYPSNLLCGMHIPDCSLRYTPIFSTYQSTSTTLGFRETTKRAMEFCSTLMPVVQRMNEEEQRERSTISSFLLSCCTHPGKLEQAIRATSHSLLFTKGCYDADSTTTLFPVAFKHLYCYPIKPDPLSRHAIPFAFYPLINL